MKRPFRYPRRRSRLVVDRGQPAHRYYYRRYRPVVLSTDPRAEANRSRWLRTVRVIGDAASMVSTMAAISGSFRLVDSNGRVYGPRYTSQDTARRTGPAGLNEYLAHDRHGRSFWFDRNTRVRIVAVQEEDFYSAACRALKAAHRKGLA